MVTAASRKGFYKTVSILALGAFVFGTNLVSKQFGSDKLDKVETQRLANISSLLHRFVTYIKIVIVAKHHVNLKV